MPGPVAFATPVMFSDLGADVYFDIENGRTAELRIVVDGEAFVVAFANSFNDNGACLFDGTTWSIDSNYSDTFVGFSLAARVSEFLSFQ
jgi:hypothetical protein